MNFVPLWNKSYCSFLEGASAPEVLVEQCAAFGYGAMALTDRDGVYGVVRAMVAAEEAGLDLIVGTEVEVVSLGRIVLLVADLSGYENLCRLLTMGHADRQGRKRVILAYEQLLAHAGGLMALLPDVPEEGAARGLFSCFGDRLYGIVTRHARPSDFRRELRLRQWADAVGVSLVAGIEVLYADRSGRRLQDILRCLRLGLNLKQAGTKLEMNDRHALPSPTEVQKIFCDAPQLVARTVELSQRCRFSLRELDYRYPADGEVDRLQGLVGEGSRKRYPDGVPVQVQQQLEHEVGLIHELGYGGYFLTMFEIVDWCRQQGILCQGRGSAANSAVCYCLGITAVDPVRMELLFERFLSRERDEPPDIDLDIEHDRRELVIQYVYQRFGRERAALAAVMTCFRGRSAIRDVGKVFGLPDEWLGRVARVVGREEPSEERLAEAGIRLDTPYLKAFGNCVMEIMQVPRQLSTHPGGFVLGQKPLTALCPVQPAAMPGRTILQWDKNDLEALRIFKMDLLGLGALSHLRRCFDLMASRDGCRREVRDLPVTDEATFEMLRKGDTVGVFQVESRAQMAMLPRLKPKVWYDLVIQISIIRPGPIVGGMVHPYLRRRQGTEEVVYPHPLLEPVLKKTLGVPLFQEQVMKVAMIAADYTAGEADQLRRDMAAWRKPGRLEGHRERLLTRMKAKGISESFAVQVFDQISGFGEYGFPESHAASFALIAWAASWLRCHEPAIFLCALLNSQPMGFYSPATLIEDARRNGVEVLPVDVESSDWDCKMASAGVAEDEAVRIGLRYVKGLGEADGRRILSERNAGGAYGDVAEVRRRSSVHDATMRVLARAGAFDSIRNNRRASMWAAWAEGLPGGALPLQMQEASVELPEMDPLERACADYRYCGHSTQGHPLAAVRARLAAIGLPTSEEVRNMADGLKVRYAAAVICRQQPSTAKGVVFLTMEDEFGFVNVLIRPRVCEQFRIVLTTSPLLGITGKLQNQEGVTHLLAERLWRPVLGNEKKMPIAEPRSWR